MSFSADAWKANTALYEAIRSHAVQRGAGGRHAL